MNPDPKDIKMKKKAAPVKKTTSGNKGVSSAESKLVRPNPVIREKRQVKVTVDNLYQVSDTNLNLAINLRRHDDKETFAREIDEGLKFFPYAVLTNLTVGGQPVSYISSMEMNLQPTNHPHPQLTVRFVEAMTAEEVEKMDPALKAQIMANIAAMQQYPFVYVESPLLGAPKKG